jgi:hypothetical protein
MFANVQTNSVEVLVLAKFALLNRWCVRLEGATHTPIRRIDMLWTIAVILLVLWLLGLVTSYTMGGFVHVLLVIAIVVVLIQVIQGRRV